MRPRAAGLTRRGWTATIGASAALAALAVAPGHAAGSVHFGDNLIGNPDSDTFCGQHCTLWNTNIYLSNTAGTVTSPINGVLVTWTIKKEAESPGTTTHPVHARVLEMVGSQWRGLGAAADVIPPTAGGIHSYPTRLPIAQGNYIAIEFDNDSAAPPMFASNIFGASMKLRSPPFPTGGPPETISGNFSGWQIFLRGTVEPDADGDGFGDETQDRCPGSSGVTAGCVPKKKCKRKKRKGKKKSAAAKKKRCKRRGKKRK